MRKAATSLAYSSPRFRPHSLSLLKRLTVLAGPTDELAKLYLGRPRRLTQASRPRLFHCRNHGAATSLARKFYASSDTEPSSNQRSFNVSVACANLHDPNGRRLQSLNSIKSSFICCFAARTSICSDVNSYAPESMLCNSSLCGLNPCPASEPNAGPYKTGPVHLHSSPITRVNVFYCLRYMSSLSIYPFAAHGLDRIAHHWSGSYCEE
jgi:hypothetical protein